MSYFECGKNESQRRNLSPFLSLLWVIHAHACTQGRWRPEQDTEGGWSSIVFFFFFTSFPRDRVSHWSGNSPCCVACLWALSVSLSPPAVVGLWTHMAIPGFLLGCWDLNSAHCTWRVGALTHWAISSLWFPVLVIPHWEPHTHVLLKEQNLI